MRGAVPPFPQYAFMAWRSIKNISTGTIFSNLQEFKCGAGIAQWYTAGLRTWWWWVRVPVAAENVSLHHCVQNGSAVHTASYLMGTTGPFPGVKRSEREADHSPPSSAEIKAWGELYLHSPNMPWWCSAQLKAETTFLLHQIWASLSTQCILIKLINYLPKSADLTAVIIQFFFIILPWIYPH
jgi:integral membrane sensor domain MASE1